MDDLTGLMCIQMRALLFVTVLTTGITGSMEKVEGAIAVVLDLQGTPALLLPAHLCAIYLQCSCDVARHSREGEFIKRLC